MKLCACGECATYYVKDNQTDIIRFYCVSCMAYVIDKKVKGN